MISKFIGAALMLCILAYVLRGSVKVLGWKRALLSMAEGAALALIVGVATMLLLGLG